MQCAYNYIHVHLWKSDFENEIFWWKDFFSWKVNSKIRMKNHAADPKIQFKNYFKVSWSRNGDAVSVEVNNFWNCFNEIIDHSDVDLVICRFKSAKNICLKNIFLRSNWLGFFVVWRSGCFFSYWFQIALKNHRAFFFQKHFERCQCV